MSELDKINEQVTQELEPVLGAENIGEDTVGSEEGGTTPVAEQWCIVATGLASDGTKVIVQHDFSDAQAAIAAIAAAPTEAGGRKVRYKAVVQPDEVEVCELVKEQNGKFRADFNRGWDDGGNQRNERYSVAEAQDFIARRMQGGEEVYFMVYPGAAKRKKIVLGAVAAAVALALVGGSAAIALNQPQAEVPVVQQSAKPTTTQTSEKQEAVETVSVTLKATAPDWTDTSTPVIAHIVSDDGKVDFYHAFAAGKDATLKLKIGTYTVTYISPINADGSIYKVPASATLKVESNSNKVSAPEATLEKVPADQVTQDQMDEVLSGIKDAVAKGDETLSGSAGQTVVDTAGSNAQAAPNVDKDKVQQATDEAKQEVAEAPSATTGSSGSASSGNSSSSGSNNAGGSTSGSNSGSTAGGASGGGSTPPEAPAHTHNWVAQTSQQWVPNVVWVQDSAAWDEPVYGTQTYVLCSDGTEWPNTQAAVDYIMSLGRGANVSYSVMTRTTQTGTIHHDATGHNEDEGHYETVTTGYVCSGCGATK